MLLFSERTWKHHCVTLLLPFAVLSYGLATSYWSRGRKWAIGSVLTGTLLLMTTTSTSIYGETLSRMEDQVGATSFVIGPAGLMAATQSGIHTDSLRQTGPGLWGVCVGVFPDYRGIDGAVEEGWKCAVEGAALREERPLAA